MVWDRRYFIRRPFQVAFKARVIAKSIDVFITLGIYLILPKTLGFLLATGLLSLGDAFYSGQSIGKRIIGFSVVSLIDGSPCNCTESFIRNLPFTLPFCAFLIPDPLIGFIFFCFLFPPCAVLEAYLIYKIDAGLRMGDLLADTTVMAQDNNQKIFASKIPNSPNTKMSYL